MLVVQSQLLFTIMNKFFPVYVLVQSSQNFFTLSEVATVHPFNFAVQILDSLAMLWCISVFPGKE
jgi:hypothetical protein